MASSKVVATNTDLPRQSSAYSSSLSSLIEDPSNSKNTSMDMDMDELLKSIYSSSEPASVKNMDEVWKEMVAGRGSNNNSTQQQQQMSLEDFLTKSKAAASDDHGTIVSIIAAPSSGTRRSGKRKGVEEEPLLDKATLQKQRRMIKNRESAARSRERNQAYTVELESLVIQLEEENARLLKEEVDKNKQRLSQLMEFLIPVVEKRKPRGMLRRVNSVQW